LLEKKRDFTGYCVEEALGVARSIEDRYQRFEALRKIVVGLAEAGEFDEALEVSECIGDKYQRMEALREVAVELARAGEPYKEILEEVVEVSQSISN